MNALAIVAVIIFLILVNGIYVAAEFSAVSSRRPRLAAMAEEGNRLAEYMLHVVESSSRLDTYVAACQLGITVSSLVLGYYGQSQIMGLLEPYLERMDPASRVAVRSISATGILLLLTVLQVILGELVPKNVGLQYPERLSLLTAPAMRWSVALFRPLIAVFNGSGRLIIHVMRIEPVTEHSHVHSPDEIMYLVEESSAGGVLDAEERRLLVNTLQLRNLTARKVMIPRNHMLTASVTLDCTELFDLLANSPFSRLPLYEETVDSIIGFVHIKDLLKARYEMDAPGANAVPGCQTKDIMHPVLHVPDSVEVEDVMHMMQRAHTHLAIVVDEYGGTAGMITFEDLVEEIIGEFQDEFDVENPPVELRPNSRIRVRGDVLIEDLNEALDILLPTTDVETVGGLVLAHMGRIPRAGDIVEVADLVIRVDRVVQNGVAAVSFPVTPKQMDRLRGLMEEA